MVIPNALFYRAREVSEKWEVGSGKCIIMAMNLFVKQVYGSSTLLAFV